MLVDDRDDAHVVLSPDSGNVPDLNLDDLGSVLAEVRSLEFADELLHDLASFVLDQKALDSLFLVATQLVSQPQKLRNRLLDGAVEVMVFVQVQERALLVKLLALLKLKFFESLVQELQEDQNTVGVDEQLAEVDELVDAVGLEVLQHVDEEVADDHRSDDSVSVVFVSVLLELKVVFILGHPLWLS